MRGRRSFHCLWPGAGPRLTVVFLTFSVLQRKVGGVLTLYPPQELLHCTRSKAHAFKEEWEAVPMRMSM